MDILSIVIVCFIILETANVAILYFNPDSTLGNGVAVFNGWEKSKQDPALHEFVKYLVYWVAGTKLIFILLLIVILLTGSTTTKTLSAVALILSVSTFYWRLFPIVRKLDARGHITPVGYSKNLGIIIGVFLFAFFIALVVSIF